MSIQTAHLSLSMHGCVCASVYKRLVSLFPFENRGGRGEREGGGEEVAKSRLPATTTTGASSSPILIVVA